MGPDAQKHRALSLAVNLAGQLEVGSGGFAGKGWLEGTQSQLQFLPTPHTDFVFAVLAEEFGFIGAIALVSLFILITIRSLQISQKAPTVFPGRIIEST